MQGMEWVKLGQLFVSLGALVCIVWLFLRSYKARNTAQTQDATDAKQQGQGWIHTLYIGGIAAFVLLEFIVYVVLGNNERADVMNTISFGATLSSLIMSIVAIIFTIVSSRNGQEQLGKVSEATRQLQETAGSLREFRTIAEHIDEHVESLFKKVNDGITSLDSKFEDRMSKLSDTIGEVGQSQAHLTELVAKTSESSGSDTTNIDERTKMLATNGSYLGAVLLVSCCYAKATGKPFDFDQMGPDFYNDNGSYLKGYLVAAAACGVVTFEGVLPNVKITNVADKIEHFAMPFIQNFIDRTDKEWRKRYIEAFNTMRAYFGLAPENFGEEPQPEAKPEAE